jgi:hypothetical protein
MDLKAELERLRDRPRPAAHRLPAELVTALVLAGLAVRVPDPAIGHVAHCFYSRPAKRSSTLVFWWSIPQREWQTDTLGAKVLLQVGEELGLWT